MDSNLEAYVGNGFLAAILPVARKEAGYFIFFPTVIRLDRRIARRRLVHRSGCLIGMRDGASVASKTMRLAGRTAIVTGGASGMGEAISALFALEGASVVVADADTKRSNSVVDMISAEGGKALAVTVDVADEHQVIKMVEAARANFMAIDILVNCAAVAEFLPAEEITSERWRRMIDIDMGGVFYCCREAGKEMIKRKYGKIINFGSTAGLTGIPYMSHYTAAKHGVVGLTKALATEWGKYNVNVNCICPGATLTPMLLSATTPAYRVAIQVAPSRSWLTAAISLGSG